MRGLDTQAAKARCWAATPGPWTPASILHLAHKDDIEFAAHARSDLPDALEALEEAQGALRELCRGHNSRGSDGPCGCSGCRILSKECATCKGSKGCTIRHGGVRETLTDPEPHDEWVPCPDCGDTKEDE